MTLLQSSSNMLRDTLKHRNRIILRLIDSDVGTWKGDEFFHARTLLAADLRDPEISAQIAAKMSVPQY
ncbi:hypothetical protein ACOSQ2_017473 [Xanthoceras sorbifolium]